MRAAEPPPPYAGPLFDAHLHYNEEAQEAHPLPDVLGRLQFGQVLLATVGSTAPFVGLLGTVWGIYHALISISGAGQITIDKVSGPVGEALIMTAAGLFVAIPAVLAYNAATRANRLVLAQLDGGGVQDLLAGAERQVDEGGRRQQRQTGGARIDPLAFDLHVERGAGAKNQALILTRRDAVFGGDAGAPHQAHVAVRWQLTLTAHHQQLFLGALEILDPGAARCELVNGRLEPVLLDDPQPDLRRLTAAHPRRVALTVAPGDRPCRVELWIV